MGSDDYGDVRHPRQDSTTLAKLGLFLTKVGNAGFFVKAYKEYERTGKNTGEITANGVRFKYCIAWFAVDAFFLYFYPKGDAGKAIIFQAIGKPEFWMPKGRHGWSIDEVSISQQMALVMIQCIIELWGAGQDKFWEGMTLSRSP
jgi:hypothetical protein